MTTAIHRPAWRRVLPAFPVLAFFLAVWLAAAPGRTDGLADPVAATGTQRLLVVPVRFPGTEPGATLDQVRQKAELVRSYILAASYGKLALAPTVIDWVETRGPLSEYRVSPYNFEVDRGRVERLLGEALGAARGVADPAGFQQVWIVAGARTIPPDGYGMIAYCANPGMLTGVRKGNANFETIALSGGGRYDGPAVVSAVNAHVGHVAHDLLHAIGGARDGKRVVPDLYDFELQSNPPPGAPFIPATFAIHVGPWDIMSQHFIDRRKPPPMPSSFTRLQLGWIDADQVASVAPGETRRLTIRPLATGKGLLAVRVPLDARRFLLVENRQPIGRDELLPAAGMLVLKVDRWGTEGADIVEAVDANPSTKTLDDAPFRPDGGERKAYVDAAAGIAIVPTALTPDGSMEVLVTTPGDVAVPR